jgi:hypothetical protein
MRQSIRSRQKELRRAFHLEAFGVDSFVAVSVSTCQNLNSRRQSVSVLKSIQQKITFEGVFDENLEFSCENYYAIDAIFEAFWIEHQARKK